MNQSAEGSGIRQVDGPSWSDGDVGYLQWYCHRTLDRAGNTIDYSYTHPAGAPLSVANRVLRKITYGGAIPGSTQWGASKRYIDLEYETRPDPQERWISGMPLVTTERLAAIVVKAPAWAGQIPYAFKRYHLTYEQSDRTDRSLLTSVEMCDATGDHCLPPPRSRTGSAGRARVTASTSSR